jgi:hypothetical protein
MNTTKNSIIIGQEMPKSLPVPTVFQITPINSPVRIEPNAPIKPQKFSYPDTLLPNLNHVRNKKLVASIKRLSIKDATASFSVRNVKDIPSYASYHSKSSNKTKSKLRNQYVTLQRDIKHSTALPHLGGTFRDFFGVTDVAHAINEAADAVNTVSQAITGASGAVNSINDTVNSDIVMDTLDTVNKTAGYFLPTKVDASNSSDSNVDISQSFLAHIPSLICPGFETALTVIRDPIISIYYYITTLLTHVVFRTSVSYAGYISGTIGMYIAHWGKREMTEALTMFTIAHHASWKLSEYLDSTDIPAKAVPHAPDFTLDDMGAVLSTFVLTFVLGEKPTNATNLFKGLGDWSRVKDNVADISKLVLKIIDKALEFGASSFSTDKYVSFLVSADAGIQDLSDRMHYIDIQIWRNDFHPTPLNLGFVEETLSRVKIMITNTPRTKSNEGHLSLLNGEMTRLRKIKTDFLSAGCSTTFMRPEPVGVYICGPPGVAKSYHASTMAMVLAAEIRDENLDLYRETDPASLIWAHTKTKFADGLKPDTKIVLFDDFLQEHDLIGDQDSEAMKIINCINTVPYHANKADVESKGKVYLHPDVLMATSNVMRVTSNVVKENKAITRRFELSFACIPCDQYVKLDPNGDLPPLLTRVIDRTKLPKDKDGNPSFSMDMSYFVEMDLDSGFIKAYGRTVTFAELVSLILDMRKRNLAWFNDKVASLEKIKATCRQSSQEREKLELAVRMSEDDIVRSITPEVYELVIGCNEGVSLDYMIKAINDRTDDKYYKMYEQGKLIDDAELVYINLTPSVVTCEDVSSPPSKMSFDYHLNYLRSCYDSSITEAHRAFNLIKKSYLENKKYVDVLLAVGGAIIATGMFASLISYARSYFQKAIPHSTNMGMPKTKERAGFMSHVPVPAAAHGGGYDPNGNALADAKISTNCYTLSVEAGPGLEFRKWGSIMIFHGDRDGRSVAHMSRHFLLRFRDAILDCGSRKTLQAVFTRYDRSKSFKMSLGDLVNSCRETPSLSSQDMVILILPTTVQPHKSILKYYANESFLEKQRGNINIRLDTMDRRHHSHIGPGRIVASLPVEDGSNNLSYSILRCIQYSLPAGPGDCGAPVVILNVGTGFNIFAGVHAAGWDTHGYASILTKQLLEQSLDELNMWRPVEAAVPNFSGSFDDHPLASKFKIIRRVEDPSSSGGSHSLVRAKTFGKITGYPPLKRPSVLFAPPGTPASEDPKFKCYDKYCNNKSLLDEEILLRVAYDKYDQLEAKDPASSTLRTIWSFEQAVQGILEEKEAGGLDLSTSCGYGLNKEFKTKAEFFGSPIDFTLPRVQALKDECHAAISTMNSGEDVEFIFIDFLKAELLKIKKIETKSTRLISGATLKMIIVARMLCGSFTSMNIRSRILNNSCLGINEVSDEWELLKQHITRFSNMAFAGDYAAFDGSHTPQLIMSVCWIINKWYNDDYSVARERLFNSISYSRHLVGDVIVEWCGGMPSGNPLTSVINTIINELLMRYAFTFLVSSGVRFDEHVVAAFVGDDNIVAPSDVVSSEFNEMTLSKYLPTIGYTYTNESKEESTVPLRHYTELEFLKRKFRFEPSLGKHVAPIREETLTEMAQWTQKSDPDNVIASKIQSIVREYALHGRTKFDLMVPLILETYKREYGCAAIHPRSTNYVGVLDEVMSNPYVSL